MAPGPFGAKSAAVIPRYSRPQMAAIWAPENRFRIWFEIEAHAADAHGRARRHPEGRGQGDLGRRQGGAERSRSTAGNVEEIDAIERVTKHDVIAFLT